MVTAKPPGDSAQKPRTGNEVTVPFLHLGCSFTSRAPRRRHWTPRRRCLSELVSVVLVRNFSRADSAGDHEL